ncbi:MAG: L-tyrosine/L-tryptophan isonitrile synthase family protein [Candidatus Babeliales bacterium]
MDKIPSIKYCKKQEGDYLTVTPDWVKANVPKVIIYKDFDTEKINFTPTRRLPRRIISKFDTDILKNNIYLPNKNTNTVAEKILSILLNSNVRRGSLSIIKSYIPILKEKIETLVDNNLPIQLVIPALPHKKMNSITTGHSIDFIDLGEYVCMQQFKNIALSIFRVYEYGVKIIIVPDGIALAHIFAQNDISGIISYRNKLSNIIKELDMCNVMEICDLEKIIRLDSSFDLIKDKIKRVLSELGRDDSEVMQGVNILKKAMYFNVPLSHSIQKNIKLMKLPSYDVPKQIKDRIDFATFEYAAILLTLRKLELIKKAYPQAIRASVHSKSTASFPINLINDSTQIFPYNGIPVVRKTKFGRNGNIRTATTILRLYEIYKYQSATEVYIKGQSEPFYYEINGLREK